MPWIGGGLKPNTTPSRKVAFSAAKPGARLRASCAGSLRSDQSLSVTNEIPEFVFWALAQDIEAGERDDVCHRRVLHHAFRHLLGDGLRPLERGGGGQADRQEDVALILVRHQAARHAVEEVPGRSQHRRHQRERDHRALQEEAYDRGVTPGQPVEAAVEQAERQPGLAMRRLEHDRAQRRRECQCHDP